MPWNLRMKKLATIFGIVGWVLMLCVQTYWHEDMKPYLNPLLWFVGAIMLCFSLFYDATFVAKSNPINKLNIPYSYSIGLATILLAIGMYYNYSELSVLFDKNPIKASQSDIVPSLQYYVRRLLTGEKVYAPMAFEGYEVLPTYFPMMWLPYILPELSGNDYRWLPIGVVYVAYFLLILSSLKTKESVPYLVIKSIALPIVISLFVKYDYTVFAFAVELLPISYYILLLIGLYRKNPTLIGVALGFCTLGRYAYSLWIIPLVFILWHANGFKYLLKVSIAGLAILLFVYVIPFLLFDIEILVNGFKYYSDTVTGQWHPQSWQNKGDVPYHLGRGLSFSYYFYELIDGNIEHRLSIAKVSQLVLSLITAIGFIFLYLKLKSKIKWNIFLLISLFGYLSVFYAFIYVPFSYLFKLPLIMGMCLLILQFWSKEDFQID